MLGSAQRQTAQFHLTIRILHSVNSWLSFKWTAKRMMVGRKKQTKNKFIFCFIACFTSYHQTLQSIQGQACLRCINHDKVVGLCSEVLMRLSYFIHIGFDKSFRLTWESNPGPSNRGSSTLPLDQNPNYVSLLILRLASLIVQ